MGRRGLWSNHPRSIISRRALVPLLLFLITGFGDNQVVVAQDENPKSQFTFPDEDDMTFYLNDTVLVSYVSSFPEPGLYAWCKDDDGGIRNVFTKEDTAPFSSTQRVVINFTTTSESNCWWNLRRKFDSPDGTNSGPFKIVAAEREGGPQTLQRSFTSTTTTSTSTTSSIENSRPTGSGESTLVTKTNAPNTATPTNETLPNTNSQSSSSSNNNNDNGGGLSTAAAAGIGVAVGVVVVVFLVALVIWLRRWKSNVIAEAVKATQNSASGGTNTYGGGSMTSGAVSFQGTGPPVGELRTAVDTPPYPIYANLNNNNMGAGGNSPSPPHVAEPHQTGPMTATTMTGTEVYGSGSGYGKSMWENYYHTIQGSGGIIKPPEEMDVERQTAEMEGDSTYGQKFQREQYR